MKNVSKTNVILFLLSMVFLYLGLYTFLFNPIYQMYVGVTTSNVIYGILKIFLLSGLFVGLGLTFLRSAFENYKKF